MRILNIVLFMLIMGLSTIFTWGCTSNTPKETIKERILGEQTSTPDENSPKEQISKNDGGLQDRFVEKTSFESNPDEQITDTTAQKEQSLKEVISNDQPQHSKFIISSSAFKNGEKIPTQYGCGKAHNYKKPSLPLSWQGIPNGTKSFVLLMDDPDAGGFIHWLVIDIPSSTKALAEGASGQSMPPTSKEFLNDFGSKGYGGPCPPDKTHRYRFRLYALPTATTTTLKSGQISSDDVHLALKDVALGVAEFQGTFSPAK